MIDIDKKFFFFYNNFDKGKLKMLHLKMSNSIKDYRKRNNETQEQTAEALDCCVKSIRISVCARFAPQRCCPCIFRFRPC